MDCHLLALKKVAEENNFGTPDIFKDESYRISNKFTLSTSQVPTSMDGSFMCYGPVVPDGYGCSYNPKPDYILFVVTSFKSCKSTSSKMFADALKQSLDLMFQLCKEQQQKTTG
jgi:choline O-acetyltransferase